MPTLICVHPKPSIYISIIGRPAASLHSITTVLICCAGVLVIITIMLFSVQLGYTAAFVCKTISYIYARELECVFCVHNIAVPCG